MPKHIDHFDRFALFIVTHLLVFNSLRFDAYTFCSIVFGMFVLYQAQLLCNALNLKWIDLTPHPTNALFSLRHRPLTSPPTHHTLSVSHFVTIIVLLLFSSLSIGLDERILHKWPSSSKSQISRNHEYLMAHSSIPWELGCVPYISRWLTFSLLCTAAKLNLLVIFVSNGFVVSACVCVLDRAQRICEKGQIFNVLSNDLWFDYYT